MLWFFFFQAEDGIRDWSVTGVQTCALPISSKASAEWCLRAVDQCWRQKESRIRIEERGEAQRAYDFARSRSEERRVGKECRSRWSPYDQQSKVHNRITTQISN